LIIFYLAVILISYFLAWTILAGEHTLSRRLTLFAVLPLVLLTAYGAVELNRLIKKDQLVVVLVPFLIYLNYFSGPILDVSISDADLDLAYEIWQTIDSKTICLDEKIEVILALEYISAKEFQETINNNNCDQ